MDPPQVITTRSYDERLDTINAVREAGISVCSGGILGLGETDADRIGLIHVRKACRNIPSPSRSTHLYLSLEHHWRATRYTSKLTSLSSQDIDIVIQRVPLHTLARTIATARIVLPTTIIRLAAGRNTLSESEQALCFMAGANAVFTGEQMLTTPCSPWDEVSHESSFDFD